MNYCKTLLELKEETKEADLKGVKFCIVVNATRLMGGVSIIVFFCNQ